MTSPGLGARLDRWWRAPAPALRLALVRVLVGVYSSVLVLQDGLSILRRLDFAAARFSPVGVVGLIDAPLGLASTSIILASGVLGALAFTCGWRYRLTAPLYALALLWISSYHNSWGHLAHAQNLAVVHVLVLSVTPAADALSLDRRAGRTCEGEPARYGWPLRLLMLTVVLRYMLAGYAKVLHGGWAWAQGDALHHQIAHNVLRKIRLGGWVSPTSPWLLGQPWIFGVAAVGTLVVELGAAVAMVRGGVRTAWVIAAWLMHLGIVAAMGIVFWYPLSGVAFASFFPLERVFVRGRREGAVSIVRGEAGGPPPAPVA